MGSEVKCRTLSISLGRRFALVMDSSEFSFLSLPQANGRLLLDCFRPAVRKRLKKTPVRSRLHSPVIPHNSREEKTEAAGNKLGKQQKEKWVALFANNLP